MGLFKRKTKRLTHDEIKEIGNGDAESRLIKKENTRIWITIGVAASIIMSIIVTSCIIDIFEKAYQINEYFGYVVLGIILLLILLFIIIPIFKVFSSPTFKLDATVDNAVISRRNYRTLKSVANNIIKGPSNVP